jgi:hypothetical protein
LVPLLDDWCAYELDFFLYYSSRRQIPLPLQTFIAFIRQHSNRGANGKPTSEKQALGAMPLAAAE